MSGKLDFFQEKISLQDPNHVEQKLAQLLQKEIHSVEDLEQFLLEETELIEAIDEVLSGDYIAFNRYNNDPEIKKRYEHNQEVIQPLLKKYEALLDKKFYESPYREQLDQQKYNVLIKSKVNSIEIFREENISLQVKEDQLHNRYFEITGSITIDWNGEEKTIPQMRKFLMSSDRQIREKAWNLIWDEVGSKEQQLNEIMNELIRLRHQIAQNAGFKTYRDYMFKKYERFDYTPEDCFQFHDAVEKHVVHLVQEIKKKHQLEIGVEDYRPWDTQAIPKGQEPLIPFKEADELVKGTIDIFEQLDPVFAKLVQDMNDHDLLDLESRKAKSPGGFCSSLPVTGLSFIFMNAVGTQDDLSTMVHEGGHCIHNLLAKEQALANYKSAPMESAEVASMAMELFTIDKWDRFYQDETDLKRAQKEHIEGIISFFPWAMVVDRFQHWIYENPQHSIKERNKVFMDLIQRFTLPGINIDGVEEKIKLRWLLQLHIFEVPFYYIEYAVAQLGALQLWKKYTEDPKGAIAGYKEALALGGSKSLPDVYATAGIKFDFSTDMIQEMMQFAKVQLDRLKS
ncbi:M3 family oligoendopeptidase [Bacillus horti]|uniref:Oligoendopeptidase F n=1 Tax=Caldalkalibacillus horti TaxID=77523 RepID=A0ABT9VW53_9BACI|nr:M3 family oligoendopeptidase [Bacillus horti]MDQ0165231.1 oligoendopeptidase F [Bacillus horti]